MSPTRRSTSLATAAGYLPLAAYAPAYRKYLLDRGNVNSYVRGCEAAVAHFSLWMQQSRKVIADIDEELVTDFAKEHLARSHCASPARRSEGVRAALVHL